MCCTFLLFLLKAQPKSRLACLGIVSWLSFNGEASFVCCWPRQKSESLNVHDLFRSNCIFINMIAY